MSYFSLLFYVLFLIEILWLMSHWSLVRVGVRVGVRVSVGWGQVYKP
jgi:hypothetical protein